MFLKKLKVLLVIFTLFSCKSNNSETSDMKPINDPHSFSNSNNAWVTHLNWNAEVNFDSSKINAVATWQFNKSDNASEIIFDVRQIEIKKVVWPDGSLAQYKLTTEKEFLGKGLVISLNKPFNEISIYYETTPQSAALQWLKPEQTANKTHPFLLTQSQAILARTWIPCQDSPAIRFTYNAKVKVPTGLLPLMSATNPQQTVDSSVYHFKMNQPIPSYLMALAVGHLSFEPIGKRTGVYAEPALIEDSKFEFSEMENMLIAAEKLYGAYDWERYDMIILPPSFPFGGMENPRITFATPTIIAGDKSLTALVAHELAHSWSGNLVTNATWNDFWMNEGFTVYFERRIMESLYGADYAEMLAELGYQDLQHTLTDFKMNPDYTKLKLQLEGKDPDDGMSDIAYEKGYFFLRLLENTFGRETFDSFILNHFQQNKFTSITTEDFLQKLTETFQNHPQWQTLHVNEWIYGSGLPDNCPKPNPKNFTLVEQQITQWKNGESAKNLQTNNWSTHEWLHFLRNLPQPLNQSQMTDLDQAFKFTQSGNAEILAAWFQHTIANNYQTADTVMKNFLIKVGRRKFLTPTYKALISNDTTKTLATQIYAEARKNYHAVAIETLDKLLNYKPKNVH